MSGLCNRRNAAALEPAKCVPVMLRAANVAALATPAAFRQDMFDGEGLRLYREKRIFFKRAKRQNTNRIDVLSVHGFGGCVKLKPNLEIEMEARPGSLQHEPNGWSSPTTVPFQFHAFTTHL